MQAYIHIFDYVKCFEAEEKDDDSPAIDGSVRDMTVSVLPCADEVNFTPETPREHETPNDNAGNNLLFDSIITNN